MIKLILICIPLAVAAGLINTQKTKPLHEYAPIVERKMKFYDFNLTTLEGNSFKLSEYAADKKLIIVNYGAAWCDNSNMNGHVLKRLYDKYKDRGLGVVVVMEYSFPVEVHMHKNRIGIDYPLVIETNSRDDQKRSIHYKYKKKAGDNRKWGLPFHVIIEKQDILQSSDRAPLATRVFTVSGEVVEAEAEKFIEERLSH